MARKLEKIEKELGYCEIKLEKEKRLKKQVLFVSEDLTRLSNLISALSEQDSSAVALHEFDLQDKPSRPLFLAAGLVGMLQDKVSLLERERDELLMKLRHFSGFEEKRRLLEDEKKAAMHGLSPSHCTRVRQLNEQFKKAERTWNELTEDVINLDEGLFYVERNLDYLKSCRNFLISAKGSYDLENGRPHGRLMDLFRHSTIGRAVEMADGADRNLRSAQKELICLTSLRFRAEGMVPVLESLMQAIFEDLFETGRLESAVQVIEAALASNLKILETLRKKRESYTEKLEEAEKMRSRVFSRLGSRRRAEVAAQG